MPHGDAFSRDTNRKLVQAEPLEPGVRAVGPRPDVRLTPAELLESPRALLDVTLDQLRTLVTVHATGTALSAARALGREQSSVQKQLDTLNQIFQALCGELLVRKQRRGEPFLFTPSGEIVVDLATRVLSESVEAISVNRRRLGQSVVVGTTEFTMELLSRAHKTIGEELQDMGVSLKVIHVRTRDFWTTLASRRVDLICGSVPSTVLRDEPQLNEFEILEWKRESMVLLTNLSRRRLPGKPVDKEQLRDLPLLLPRAGIVADFLRSWYGPKFMDDVRLEAEIDDIYYGLALMRTGLVRGCMVVAQEIGLWASQEPANRDEALRVVRLAQEGHEDDQLVTGAFVRKVDLQQYGGDHPLRILWSAIQVAIKDSPKG